METKKTFLLLGIALFIGSNYAAAGFIPHNEPLVSQKPPKPNIYMILDDSGSMNLTLEGNQAFPETEHEHPIRYDVLRTVVQNIVDQYHANANLGFGGLGQQGRTMTGGNFNYQWPRLILEKKMYKGPLGSNTTYLDLLAEMIPELKSSGGMNDAYSREHFSPHYTLITPITDFGVGYTDRKLAEFKRRIDVITQKGDKPWHTQPASTGTMITFGYYGGLTPLGDALYEATKYFRNKPMRMGYKHDNADGTLHQVIRSKGSTQADLDIIQSGANKLTYQRNLDLQYRCQENHVLLLTDGNSNQDYTLIQDQLPEDKQHIAKLPGSSTPENSKNYAYLAHIAQLAWNLDLRDYVDSQRTTDAAGKPWFSEGSKKLPIHLNAIRFGSESAADDTLKPAVAYSGGLAEKAENQHELFAVFHKIFQSIIGTRSGTGAVEDQGRNDVDTIRYSSFYDPSLWVGEIRAVEYNEKTGEFPPAIDVVDKNGNVVEVSKVKWTTLNTIKPDQGRFVTFKRSGSGSSGEAVPLTDENLGTAADKHFAQWLKGNNVEGLRYRGTPLGDIINSHITYVAKDRLHINTDLLKNAVQEKFFDYLLFKDEHLQNNLLIAGSNDGMVNFIIADKNSGGKAGQRHTTYFPSFFADDLEGKNYTSGITGLYYTHNYKVNGATSLFDAYVTQGNSAYYKTLGLTFMGAGKKGFVGYEVFSASGNLKGSGDSTVKVNFEITDEHTDFKELGYTYTEAEFFNQANADASAARAVAVIGNGFGSASDNSVVYLVDANNGDFINKVTLGKGYGAASPALVIGTDANSGYQKLEAIYVGDYSGKLYKVAVSYKVPSNSRDPFDSFVFETSVMLDVHENPNAAGVAYDALPITTKPSVVIDRKKRTDVTWVYFGTGMAADYDAHTGTPSQVVHSYYGIKDIGRKHDFQRLDKQSLISNKNEKMHQAGHTTYDSYSSSNVTKEQSDNGWYLPLTSSGSPLTGEPTGERVVQSSAFFSQTFIHFVTWGIIPGHAEDLCLGDDIFGRLLFLQRRTGNSVGLNETSGNSGILYNGDAPGLSSGGLMSFDNKSGGNNSSGLVTNDNVLKKLAENSGSDKGDSSYPPAKILEDGEQDDYAIVNYDTEKGGSGSVTLNIADARDKEEEEEGGGGPKGRLYLMHHL